MSNLKIEIELLPNGQLGIILPGTAGGTRTIALKFGEEGNSIRKILEARQIESDESIGTTGYPTSQQQWHFENHRRVRDGRCPFCRDEAIGAAWASETPVKKLKTGASVNHKTLNSKQSAEELGL